MRVTIVGGGLQGVELCWLARKAGWGTLLVDERPAPPALRLADVFAQCDVTKLGGSGVLTRKVEHQILGTDIVIPALEMPPRLPRSTAGVPVKACCSPLIPAPTRSPPPN